MKKIISTFLAMLGALLCCPERCCDGAVDVQVHDPPTEAACRQWAKELLVIIKAARRNECTEDNYHLLLAIRKAENGSPGREFGILHPRCLAEIRRRPQDSLDIQAGWAAATIVKNRLRWKEAGSPGEFIDFLADRYCPPSEDYEGNRNWKRNVKFFYNKFKTE